MINLMRLLDCFYLVMGFMINYLKYVIIMFGKKEDWLFKLVINYYIKLFLKYLGILIGVNLKNLSLWELIIRKIKSKFLL